MSILTTEERAEAIEKCIVAIKKYYGRVDETTKMDLSSLSNTELTDELAWWESTMKHE